MSLSTLFTHYSAIVSNISADNALQTSDMDVAFGIMPLIIKAMQTPEKNHVHYELTKFIARNRLQDVDIIKAYLDEFEDLSYDDMGGGEKRWRNFSSNMHRVTKDENGLTKPARITKNSSTWYVNGKCHREDKDKFGNYLPANIQGRSQSWYWEDKQHRAELGNNPDDIKNFGKALPAYIDDSDGCQRWYYRGNRFSESDLTKKLIDKKAKFDAKIAEYMKAHPANNFTNIDRVEIVLKNGSTVSLTDCSTVRLITS